MKIMHIAISIVAVSLGVLFLEHAFSTDGIQLLASVGGGGLVGAGVSWLTITLLVMK